MDIVTLCIDAYLKGTSRFSPQGHILRHRCTKTVPRLVLLDANALLMPFQFQVHLDAELRRVVGDVEIAVPTPVLAELDLLADHDRNARAAAKLATNYRTIEAHGSAGDALLDLAAERRPVVVTNDQPLLDRLKAAGIPRVFLRSRNHLVAEGRGPCGRNKGAPGLAPPVEAGSR